MQCPLLKGVHFTWVPCNEVVQSKHSEWGKDTDQNQYENRHLRHFISFYQKHSPKLRLYWKKERREGKTDKPLRTPYSHWSMHGLNQCNLQMPTAFTDTNFSFVNNFRIFHNKRNYEFFQSKRICLTEHHPLHTCKQYLDILNNL